MAIDRVLAEDTYFMRRLHEIRTLESTLPASVQFDIARLPIQDAQVMEITRAFGAPPVQTLGFSDLAEDLFSSDPQKVSIDSVKQLQTNLQEQGYLAPDYSPTGTWDQESQIAFSRADRDAYDAMRSGKRFASADMNAGLRMLTNTMPPQVFQGILGLAKGMAQQVPETATRVGALGGMVAGAGLGAQILGPAGLLGGAIAGGIAGFFADLLTTQAGEEDQGIIDRFIDALSPYEEYMGEQKNGQSGLANFFEDLDTVMIASAFAGGARWGVQGVSKGLAATQANREAGLSLGRSLWAPTERTLSEAAGAPTAIINALERSKRFGNIGWVQGMHKWLAGSEIRAGVYGGGWSLTGRPIFQMSNSIFTGASVASLGGRMFAGFDFQTSILDENGEIIDEKDPWTGEVTDKQTRGTKIEKAIADAPLPQTGVDIPVFEDMAYLSAFLLQPQRFLPWKIKHVGDATSRMMQDGRLLTPAVHAIQHETPGLSFNKAYQLLKEQIFGGPDGQMLLTYRWVDWAVTRKALLSLEGDTLGSGVKSFVGFKRQRAALIRTVREEAEEFGHSPTLSKALKEAMEHPETFEAHLVLANGKGSGLSNMRRWREATDLINDLETELKGNAYLKVEDTLYPLDQLPPAQALPYDLEIGPQGRSWQRPSKQETRTFISSIDGEEVKLITPRVREGLDEVELARVNNSIKHIDERLRDIYGAKVNTTDLRARATLTARTTELKGQRAALVTEREALMAEAKLRTLDPNDMRLSLMKKDEFTKADYNRLEKEIRAKSKLYNKLTRKGASSADDLQAQAIQREVAVQVDDLAAEGYLSAKTHETIKRNFRKLHLAADELHQQGRLAARDVQLPERHMQTLDKLGYKPVWTGEDMLWPNDMSSMIGLLDLPEYKKVWGFLETVGMSPHVRLDEDLFELRHAYLTAALDEALDKIRLTRGLKTKIGRGSEVLYLISKYMRDHNLAGATHGPIVFEKGGGIHLYRVDARQLKVKHIEEALETVIPGIGPQEAMDIYGAIKTGSAWGGVDFFFTHPVQSARAMGRALRLNGLPGFSDLIRTWHAKTPLVYDPVKVGTGRQKYVPVADLQLSVERNRFMEELNVTASRLNMTPGKKQQLEMIFDSLYYALHNANKDMFPTPDMFFRGMSAEYLRSIEDVSSASGLFKAGIVPKPTKETLLKIAQKYTTKGDQWYPHSGNAVRAMYEGIDVTLQNMETVDAAELFFRVLAVSSGGEWPKANVTKALRVVDAFIDNPHLIFKFPTVRDNELMMRVFRDGWVPDTPKMGPFYQAIKGNPDAIVLDRRMADLFGFSRQFTDAEAAVMRKQVEELADRLGISNAAAQSRLWVGYRDRLQNLAKFHRNRNPELAAEFQKLADDVLRDPTGDFPYDFYLGQSHLEKVNQVDFVAARPDSPNMTLYSPEELAFKSPDGRVYLNKERNGGFVIGEDGEIINLFAPPGMGRQMLAEAIHRGGRRVTFYDVDGLGQLYKDMGFREVKRTPFDLDKTRVRGVLETEHIDYPKGWDPGPGDVGKRQHGQLPTKYVARHADVYEPHLRGKRDYEQGDRWARFLEDIRENGIQEPITIWVNDARSTGRPRISIEGHRRLQAAEELGLKNVPVEVRYMGRTHAEGWNLFGAPAPKGVKITAPAEYQLLDPGDFLSKVVAEGTGPVETKVIRVGNKYALQETRTPSRILDGTYSTKKAAEAKAAELRSAPAKAAEYGEPTRELRKTRGYVYHGTDASRADQIAMEGLRPGSRSRRMDALDDKTEYIFFGDEPLDAINAPSNVGHWAQQGIADRVLLRVKKSKVPGIKQDIEAEWLSSGRVSADDIEYLGPDNKWHPLADRRKAQLARGGPDYVEAVRRKGQPDKFGRSRAEAQRVREELKKLGHTKVVDMHGRPLRVYHGTADVIDYFAEGGGMDPGVVAWFSDSPHIANEWALFRGVGVDEIGRGNARAEAMGLVPRPLQAGRTSNITAAFLDIRNPIRRDGYVPPEKVDAMIEWAKNHLKQLEDELDEALAQMGMTPEEYEHLITRGLSWPFGPQEADLLLELANARSFVEHLENARTLHVSRLGVRGDELIPNTTQIGGEFRNAAEHVGYDGIILETDIHTFHLGGDHFPPMDAHKVFIPFDQAQIKTGFHTPTLSDEAQAIANRNLSPGSMLQIVEGQVLGQLQYGEEFGKIIRAFQNGDFSTLVHEASHLLRISLPESEMIKIEAMLGIRPLSDTIDDLGPLKKMQDVTDEHIEQMLSAGREGGFTFDPHISDMIDPDGFAVGMAQGTFRKVDLNAPDGGTAQMREVVDELLDEYGPQYKHDGVNIGGWKDDEGILHVDPSEVVEDFDNARRKAALRHQESIYDFQNVMKFEDQTFYLTPEQWKSVERGWTPEKEELFADFINECIFEPIMTGKWSGLKGNVRKLIGSAYHKIRPWAVNGGYIPNGLRAYYDRVFLDVFKEMGYAPRRTDLVSKQVAAGALIGAAEGALFGDEGWAKEVALGSAYGAAGGLGAKKLMNRTYGYLPDSLARLNTALRYTFSVTFDAGRYVEQNTMAAMKYGIRPTFYPKKALGGRMWKTPYADYMVTGDEAVTHAMRLWDDLYGAGLGKWVDDTDRRAYQLGILGFSPRHHEAYQALSLFQKGWSPQRIKEAVSTLGRYGLGRSNLEKSINFVFFPFSFSKKLILTLGDWTIQQPGRNLLIAEGVRRYHESSLDERFHDLVENHVPLLQQLWQVNNLAFGISPGRFFLEGLTDNRTHVGQAAQALASVFIPSGAATPLAKAAGGLGDLSVTLFTPLVLTGESLNRAGGVDSLDDIVRRYFPLVREVSTYYDTIWNQQRVAFLQGRTPWSQFQEYSEGKRELMSGYDQIAWGMGYSDGQGLMGSGNPMGMLLKGQYEEELAELGKQYPRGLEMTAEFTNTSALDKQAMVELADKQNKSAAEEAILDIAQRQQNWQSLARTGAMDPALVDLMLQQQIWAMGSKWADDDRFAELWERFFQRTYGPIRRTM